MKQSTQYLRMLLALFDWSNVVSIQEDFLLLFQGRLKLIIISSQIQSPQEKVNNLNPTSLFLISIFLETVVMDHFCRLSFKTPILKIVILDSYLQIVFVDHFSNFAKYSGLVFERLIFLQFLFYK